MPREQINFPDLSEKDRQTALVSEQGDNPAGVDGPPSEFGPWNEASLHVGWNPLTVESSFGWVQVGLEGDLNYLAFAQANPNGERNDRTVMWTPTLNEDELDRLIATLKRAKRKAFTPARKA